jgi:hypothetical protein
MLRFYNRIAQHWSPNLFQEIISMHRAANAGVATWLNHGCLKQAIDDDMYCAMQAAYGCHCCTVAPRFS